MDSGGAEGDGKVMEEALEGYEYSSSEEEWSFWNIQCFRWNKGV